MANIRKRNGSWQVRVYIGRDANGKQLFKTATCSSEKEARKVAREFEQQKDDGKLSQVENIRVVAWTEKWLELNKNSYSPSTRVLYTGYIKNHYKPYFKNLKLKDLNDIHLKEFQNELLGKMSPTSARRVLSALRKMLGDALKKQTPELKLPREKKRNYTIPTAEEFEKISAAVKGTRDEPIVLLAGWCGLRRAEIFALKKNDLDFKNNTVRIDEALAINENNEYEFKEPKSENGLREVPAPEYLMTLLKEITKKKKGKKVEELNSKQKEKDERIFPNRPDNYSSYWAKLVRKKKMPKIRFHDLRHYYATWLYYNNIPDKYAAKLLGDDEDTLRYIYQHLGLDKETELEQKVRALQNNQKTEEQ